MLEIIVVTILIATVLNIILHKINIPTIIGYILTGILIDQIFGLHQAVRSHELKTLAEFGVVFLMFTIGLEFSVRHLMRLKKDVFWYGGLQVTISAVFIGLIGYNFFDLDVKTSILFGGALAVSSTAIVLKMLKENGEISRRYGRKAVGILLFQDIAVIPMLLMITIFSTNNLDVSDLLIDTFTKAFILFAIMIVVGKYILEYFLEKVVSTESDEILIGSILLIVIGSSSLAHGLGFSYSLGAFMAGMMIAETHYRHRVEEEFTHFRDMLLGVFFITVGMQVDFGVIFSNVEAIVTLLLGISILKMTIIFLIYWYELGKQISFETSLALFQMGEFGLVIFELAKGSGLISGELSQIVIATIILSMTVTPFVIKKIASLHGQALK